MKLRSACVVVASVGAVSACGGGPPVEYAGMAADDAAVQAHRAATEEVRPKGHPLHGRDLRFSRAVRGQDDGGRDAWIIVLDVGKNERRCVWIWADEVPFNVTYTYYMDKCTKQVLRAKADLVAR